MSDPLGENPSSMATDEGARTEPTGAAGPVPEGPAHEAPTELAAALDESFIGRFDKRVDQIVDRNLRGKPAIDRLMYTISELADFSLLWHLIGVARGLRSDRDFDAAVRLSASLGAESALVNGLIKSVVKRERPVAEFERPLHLRVPLTSSFPSGHASAAFCAAALLSDGDRLAPLYYATAATAAASRVHVRIHHPSDVLAGAIIGTIVGRTVRHFWRLPGDRRRR